MEIEVEAERPEDSRSHRTSAKRSSEKSRKTKHRSSNHNGSAEGSRKQDSKPKIFRLLRSRGRLSDYKAKLTQFLSGIISRNVFCTFLTETLSKSEIKLHNKFILGVLRNDRHNNKRRDEKRKSKHCSKRERSADREAVPEQVPGVTKDRDGFTVPPPKKEKHHSRRGHRNGDHEYSDRCAQHEGSSSSTTRTPGSHSAELVLPAELKNYLHGLDSSALEHLLQETSLISQHLQVTTTASLPHSAMEPNQTQTQQTPANETLWQLPPSVEVAQRTVSFEPPRDPNVSRISGFPVSAQLQSQCSYGNPSVSHYGGPEISEQHHEHFVQRAPVAYGAQNGFAQIGQSDLPLAFSRPMEANFGANVPESFAERIPNELGATSQHGTLPGVVEDLQEAPDPSDPNLWWNSIVDPSLFQRSYQVLNGSDAHGASYERSAMWAQQFLQSNEHENDYIYSSGA